MKVMTTVPACRDRLMGRKESFMADQRGAVAFEMPVIWLFLMFSLLLPLADLAVAGFQTISAWQALRGFGQSILYNTPPDVTNASTWKSTALAKADPDFPISNFQIICGESQAVCSASNTQTATGAPTAKYYSYATTITLAPMVLRSVLCTSGNANPCTFTVPYTERFQ
jgi:hypothetical protein